MTRTAKSDGEKPRPPAAFNASIDMILAHEPKRSKARRKKRQSRFRKH